MNTSTKFDTDYDYDLDVLRLKVAELTEQNRRLNRTNAHLQVSIFQALNGIAQIQLNLTQAYKQSLAPTDLRAEDYGQ